jgi:ribosomal protein L34E
MNKELREAILEIICRGKHKRGGPACQASCGIQLNGIMRVLAASEAPHKLINKDHFPALCPACDPLADEVAAANALFDKAVDGNGGTIRSRVVAAVATALTAKGAQVREECAAKLEKIAAQYEAGGHTHRGKMLRALAAEFRARGEAKPTDTFTFTSDGPINSDMAYQYSKGAMELRDKEWTFALKEYLYDEQIAKIKSEELVAVDPRKGEAKPTCPTCGSDDKRIRQIRRSVKTGLSGALKLCRHAWHSAGKEGKP